MKSLVVIMINEFKHFIRSPFKVAALFLFMLAAIYGLQNGYDLYKTHQSGIRTIKEENKESVDETVRLFDEGKTGPEERPWIDIRTPFWAGWSTPSSVFKEPSSLMVFSIGQAEQFGYYKNASAWSTTFDNDLAEEIANPERLALGTLDFGFVILYLLPILIIVLLFNIGGLEKDLAFDRLIEVTHSGKGKWLLARFLFYFVLLTVTLFCLMVLTGILTPVFQNESEAFVQLFILIFSYVLFWFCLLYFINLYGKGSASQALKMVVVWLLLCVVIPGGIHQFISLGYPAGYMTDYIDANREEANKIWDLPSDSVYTELTKLYPEIEDTEHAKDTVLDPGIIRNSFATLYNELMKSAALTIEENQENKNKLVKATYWVNPIGFFQNKMNAFANTDYYAYQSYRTTIQFAIDHKVETLLFDSWNKRVITKNDYLEYVGYYKN